MLYICKVKRPYALCAFSAFSRKYMPEICTYFQRLTVRTRPYNPILCRLHNVSMLLCKKMHNFCIYFSDQKNTLGSFDLVVFDGL